MKNWQWLLTVHNGRNHDLMLHKLGLRPSRYDATEYISFYSPGAKPQLLRHIEWLKTAGLHGVAKKVPDRRRKLPRRPKRTQRPMQQPDTHIIQFQTAKENRLAHDALKLAQEKRRQAELAAEAEINRRAKEALRKSKGEP